MTGLLPEMPGKGGVMENGWTKRIEELTKSRDDWKREWRLLNAGLNMAEDKIKELEAENKRLRERVQSVMDEHFDETSGIYEDFKQALKEASHE